MIRAPVLEDRWRNVQRFLARETFWSLLIAADADRKRKATGNQTKEEAADGLSSTALQDSSGRSSGIFILLAKGQMHEPGLVDPDLWF